MFICSIDEVDESIKRKIEDQSKPYKCFDISDFQLQDKR